MTKKTGVIRKIYLYLVTTITIIILLIGFIGILNLLLKEYVLDVKDWGEMDRYWECEEPVKEGLEPDLEPVAVVVDEDCIAEAKEQREIQHVNDLKRDFAQYLAMILVALPLYLYHWGLVKKEK